MSFWKELGNIALGSLIGPEGALAVAISRNIKSNGVSEANELTKQCNQMAEIIDKIQEDETEYIVDMNDDISDLKEFKNDKNQELQELYNNIGTLEKKKSAGTITEDEQKELDAKYEELGQFDSNFKSEYGSKYKSFVDKNATFLEQYDSDIKDATALAKEGKSVGKELAKTKVSGGVIKKIFGRTGKDKKQAGEKLVEASTNLGKKVDNVRETELKIKTK